MSSKHDNVETIFAGAVGLSGPERERYLARTCGNDAALRERVEKLLRALDRAGGFLTRPEPVAAGVGSSATESAAASATVTLPITEKVGDRIGRYKLLQQIGEGGCGVVYMAEQEEPVRRRVALKVIKLGMDTKSVIARFEAERQALALMDHANIAKVFDGGATETGRPYFVLELVRGVRITDYCDQNNLGTADRLRLFIQVCHAVQHAHQKGIIHRDIKPSNILVSLHDDIPVPKIIDFGIAKAMGERLTDKTFYTRFEQFMGTPAYMSPEQAGRSDLDIDTRSDIYALGVLLYELLIGHPPFDPKHLAEAGLEEMVRCIREEEPLRPSTRLSRLQQEELTTTAQRRGTEPPKLISLLRSDLDWIVMKCLEKNRTRRYDTANGLALDIERHLNHEPVTARPPSAAYRVQKFVRRNKVMVIAGAAVTLTLVLGVVVSTWLALRATQAERKAEQALVSETAERQKAVQAQAEEARQRRAAQEAQRKAEAGERTARLNAYASDMNVAFQALRDNRLGRVRELLERHRPQPGERDLRSWEWGHLWHESQSQELFALAGHAGSVNQIVFSPSAKYLASGSGDRTAKVWDVASRREVASLPHLAEATAVQFTPDEKCLITGACRPDVRLRYWNVGTWQLTTTATNDDTVMSLAVSSDGKYLAVGEDHRVVVRDTASAELLAMVVPDASRIQFLPRQPVLVFKDRTGLVLWNVERQTVVRTIPLADGLALAISPDGAQVAVGGAAVQVFDLNRGDQWLVLTNAVIGITSLAYSPDGTKLAAADRDGTITLWETRPWKPWGRLRGHELAVTDVAFSPDGQMLASASKDRTIRFWSTSKRPEGIRFDPFPEYWIHSTPTSGEVILTMCKEGKVEIRIGFPLRETVRVQLPEGHRGEPHASPCGRFLVVRADDGSLELWDVRPTERRFTLGDNTVYAPLICFSPDSQLLMGVEEPTHTRIVWRVSDGKEIARQTYDEGPHGLYGYGWGTWGWDSRTYLAYDKRGRGVYVWDVAQDVIRDLLPHQGGINHARMSRDGRLIATMNEAGEVKVWDARDYRELRTFPARPPALFAFDFTPDNRRLVVGDAENQVTFYDLLTGQEVGTLHIPGAVQLIGVTFSLDGKRLVVGALPAGLYCFETTPLDAAGRQ